MNDHNYYTNNQLQQPMEKSTFKQSPRHKISKLHQRLLTKTPLTPENQKPCFPNLGKQ